MRLLFLSNYYPPVANGGYEQLCQETAEELARRGHDVTIVTSRARGKVTAESEERVRVHRDLYLDVEAGMSETIFRLLGERVRAERINLERVSRIVATFKPDAALIWGMWNVPRSVPALVERLLPGRVAYYFCDYWPALPNAYLQRLHAPSTRLLTRGPRKLVELLLAPRAEQVDAERSRFSLRFDNPICVSDAVRSLLASRDVPMGHPLIVPNGIRVDDFVSSRDAQVRSDHGMGLKLLYAGRLSPEKGVLVAVRGLARVQKIDGFRPTLDVVGGGPPGYTRGVHDLVRRLGLEETVTFRGNVSRAEMPRVFTEYDALVFPSEWEASPRVVMEAMAAGLVVIGTTAGGTGEILEDGVTGLTFPVGDDDALAERIKELARRPELARQLALEARRRVAEKFTFEQMVLDIEAYLGAMVAGVGV